MNSRRYSFHVGSDGVHLVCGVINKINEAQASHGEHGILCLYQPGPYPELVYETDPLIVGLVVLAKHPDSR